MSVKNYSSKGCNFADNFYSVKNPKMAEENGNNNPMENFLINGPFNISLEENIARATFSSSFNGTTLQNDKNIFNDLDWFEYQERSKNTTGKPTFDYDTSVRVVMLSVLLGGCAQCPFDIIIMINHDQ